ncbi:hypothetical protein PsorP6_012876 [Peronosclerospora sorghi]|uniref:Uncharacterized protein n=1 Tax=Peronosclerospora sorghi TaxID=230839 RepID=A0ACC0WIZ2_9STRA|nr:hypothetical protein PsorP6_012876 [Peronosclerospora sorghi]
MPSKPLAHAHRRESECDNPSVMAFKSSSSRPEMSVSMLARIPRITSFTALSLMHGMLSFSLINEPSALSETASLSLIPASTTFFFKNFLSVLPILPSTMSVAAATASVVSLKALKPLSFSTFEAFSGVEKCLNTSSALANLASSCTLNSAWPAAVSKRTSIVKE